MTEEEKATEYISKSNPTIKKEWLKNAFEKYKKGEDVRYLDVSLIKEYEAYLDGLHEGQDENESLQQKYLSESYEKSKLVSENNKLLDVINNQDVKIADLEKMLAEQYPDLKQSLDWANERENENIKEITELKAQIKVLEQNLEDTEICNKALEIQRADLKKKNKWYSEQVCFKECSEVWGQLEQAKQIIKNIIRVTWGEGWNYSLDVKVKAEQFIKEQENEKED